MRAPYWPALSLEFHWIWDDLERGAGGNGDSMDEYDQRAFQYRQRAEELRAILSDMTDRYCHDTLETIALEYDRLAKVQERLGKMNPPPPRVKKAELKLFAQPCRVGNRIYSSA